MCIEEGVQEFEELQEFRSQNPGARRFWVRRVAML
jgi:hypothetical protein